MVRKIVKCLLVGELERIPEVILRKVLEVIGGSVLGGVV